MAASIVTLLAAPALAYFAPAGVAMRPHLQTAPASFARPCVVRRHPQPSAMEADEAYRLLGVAEESSYDEVEKSFDELMLQYSGEPKTKIKLQIAKDKINDARLSKAMGQLKTGRLSAPVNPFERVEGPKPLITIPPRLQPYMELPTKEDLITNVGIFAVIGLLPALSKSWTTTSVGMGFALGMWRLYMKGAPPQDMEASMRPPKPKPVIFTVLATLLSGMVAGSISTLLYGFLRFMFTQELVISFFTSMGFCFSSTMFKVEHD